MDIEIIINIKIFSLVTSQVFKIAGRKKYYEHQILTKYYSSLKSSSIISFIEFYSFQILHRLTNLISQLTKIEAEEINVPIEKKTS